MAQPATKDLAHYQGDTFEAEVTLRLEDGSVPPGLGFYTFAAQIRKARGLTSPLAASFVIDTSTVAADGRLRLSLDAETTAAAPIKAFWDLQMTTISASPSITTLCTGTWSMQQEVTRP